MTYLRCTWHDHGERCPNEAAPPTEPPYRVLCPVHQHALEHALAERAEIEPSIAARAPHA